MAAEVTSVLGAAASAVAPLLLGPVRDGSVLGAFSRAVIVGLPTESGPRVVSLLARGAAAVPNGVRLSGAAADLHRVRVGAPVELGAGWVRIGSLEVRVVRSWSTRAPRISPDMQGVAALAAAASARERGVPPEAISRLEIALSRCATSDQDDHELDGAVDGLIGLGRGLTPGGDDVLAGLLIGLRAGGRTDTATTIACLALLRVAERTTLLSADLLRLAAAGEACLEVLALLRAIHRPPSAQVAGPGVAGPRVTNAINRILSIGHTSGADLATGLALGLMLALGCDREAAMTAAGQGIA